MSGHRYLSIVLLLLIAHTARTANATAPTADAITVTIDATKVGPKISPFIYGQFIEHLGRCVYGGIWAEMLEDRKFYYPITHDYHPYADSKQNRFPVVAASPWEVVGPEGSVAMTTEEPFVGEHTPLVAAGSGIRQNDIAVIANKEYVGHIWFRAAKGKSSVRISLVIGGDEKQDQSASTKVSANEYTRFPFKFTVPASTDHAQLLIKVDDAPCFIGTVSLMPADNVRGMRADTLALLKELHGTIYRWPGGNFVSGYNWRDGIGPRDMRPPRKNPAWTGVEHNDFGLDDFIRFCKIVGAEPMIAVNTGFGDDYSAAQEVEYANGGEDTIGGAMRSNSGHEEPYDVKYWCVGNEMWGAWQLGHIPLKQYVQKHNLTAKAMHDVDPGLVLVGSCDLGTQATLGDGKNERKVNWSEGMLEKCADNMDFVSEHFYCGRLPWTSTGKLPITEHVGQLRAEIRAKAASHRELQSKLGRNPKDFIPIAMDEWNYWHRDYVYGELGCEYNLADALGIAVGLHEYFRNSDIIQMAEYAQTVNVIGCIKTTKTAAFFDTTALPLLLYRREFGTLPLEVTGDHDKKAIDVSAAKTEDGDAITIGVVNPNAEPQSIEVKVAGAKVGENAKVWRIASGDPETTNTPEKQAVKIDEKPNVPFADRIQVPAFSVSVYRLPVN
jgi:alpha-N-arabinofuranosidase